MAEDDDEYKMVQEYIANHHGTHGKNEFGFGLDVLDVFRVDRHGEAERFKPWEKNPNRQLLWHGSRVTNWCGIVSQVLRIAPPEAPCSGYLFGKGVYFADMVSKSAHYCRTSSSEPTGVMMLAEVALGDEHKVQNPTGGNWKLPTGQSTFCEGARYPDPAGDFTMPNGCKVPLGKPMSRSGRMSYDEKIVYDVNVVRMRYLVKMNFSHSRW